MNISDQPLSNDLIEADRIHKTMMADRKKAIEEYVESKLLLLDKNIKWIVTIHEHIVVHILISGFENKQKIKKSKRARLTKKIHELFPPSPHESTELPNPDVHVFL